MLQLPVRVALVPTQAQPVPFHQQALKALHLAGLLVEQQRPADVHLPLHSQRQQGVIWVQRVQKCDALQQARVVLERAGICALNMQLLESWQASGKSSPCCSLPQG